VWHVPKVKKRKLLGNRDAKAGVKGSVMTHNTSKIGGTHSVGSDSLRIYPHHTAKVQTQQPKKAQTPKLKEGTEKIPFGHEGRFSESICHIPLGVRGQMQAT